jgi:large subunit ribosomal protein L4
LSARAADDRVILIDPLAFDAPSTRKLVKYLGGIGAVGKVLVLTHGNNDAVVLSARNAPELVVRPFGEESVYDILWARTVVIERGALDESAESDAEEETDA